MNSEELISYLQKNPSDVVLIAHDPEGNSYSSIDEVSNVLVFRDYIGGPTEEVFEADDLVDENDPDESVLAHFKTALAIYPS